MKGLVFDLQSFSVHDGPGCRTSVFLMGCPLRCRWCANPEGWEERPRLLFREARCVHAKQPCVRCEAGCPKHAITFHDDTAPPVRLDWSVCENCTDLDCVGACLHEAMVSCGRWLTLPDLKRQLERDRQYWGDNGGVTFTGGDPLTQGVFLQAALKSCQESYIHTAVETCACFSEEHFLAALQYADFAFIDIKHMDPVKHRQQTGMSNELVLCNVAALVSSGWQGKVMIRLPVIAGFNDDEENLVATAQFLKRTGLNAINILPFHRLGESKWRQLGMDYPYADYEATPATKLYEMQELFQRQEIICYVGHDTPF